VAVLAVVMWQRPVVDTLPATQTGSAVEDLDLLADAPEFIDDALALDFYEWAAGEVES
jgi:hypothetical protein